MDKVIFVGFDTEQQASEGQRALHDLHRDGTLTLYNDAVVVKEPGGQLALRQAPDAEPVGTFGGMFTGGLVGLLGGPVGAAVGLGAGTVIGAAFDLTKQGLDREFLEDVGARLEPGKAAVIAEIDESWQVPLDTRMEALGGALLRRTPTEIDDAYLEREIEAAERELAGLEAETLAVKASTTERARQQVEKLQAKIDGAKRTVRQKQDELAAKMQSLKDEADEKIARLDAQKATTTAQAKAQLERRLADLRTAYRRRIERMQQALDRRRASQATSKP
jgi:uncharacterized membrane protein